MPRKTGYQHLESTRNKIQAALLIKRLHDHVVADAPILDASQVNAAKALLNKVLPDLTAVEMSGDPDRPVKHVVETHIVDHRPPDKA